ncbi:hypothetical protein QR680_003867 [Steinernema hermaphroditum]|uniref:Domain of unknown function DB domain-containing protein n=1 Tax=Steinernema hermaphroditum TaxID=289476 RepID=A0AA39HLV2_9BILA|nr:hypothetical protein QR680_003867 [Steinernema hermaphroditum]
MFSSSSLVLLLFITSLNVYLLEGCLSSGVCVTCSQPQPVCRGGCGGGYSCGQYGCYKARAASSKTLHMSKRKEESSEEEISKGSDEFDDIIADDLAVSEESVEREPEEPQPKTADEKFLDCCRERHLPDECLNKCSFRTYTRDALQAMYFRVDRCPMQAAAEIQFCAAQGKNHVDCCARNGVASTLIGAKCLTFCDQTPGQVTQLDFSYLACFDKFESMKSCFWYDINRDQKVHLRRSEGRFGKSRDERPERFDVIRNEKPFARRFDIMG